MTKRTESRELLMKMMFEMELQGDFSEENKAIFEREMFGVETEIDREYFDKVFEAYIIHNNEIDELIESYSKGWKLERIGKIDLTVMRLSIAEFKYLKDPDIPTAASVSEAVRLAKLYSGPVAGKFVNGILGSISRIPEEPQDAPKEAES